MVHFLFLLFELFLFFLPILPPQWYLRFFIALVYFIGHQYKVQHLYLYYKNKYLPKKELPFLQKELPIENKMAQQEVQRVRAAAPKGLEKQLCQAQTAKGTPSVSSVPSARGSV